MHREEEILYFGVSAAFAVGITLLLWLLVQIWNKFRALKYSISDIPLPGFNPFDGPTVTCTCENSCQKHVTQLESAVVGCNFISVPRSKIPKVQVALYSMTNNSRLEKYLGAAVRIGDYLVAPHHVLAASEKFGALSNSEPATAFWLDAANFESLDGDLVATSLSESSFALLGLAKANLATVDGPSMAAITSASRTPEISFGVLNHDPKIFGGMIFGGSTKGGFSGAAYMIGKQIAGIHLGGGVVNYGVNATYIQALLRKPETAEWLNMLRKKNGPLKYSRSKFNPDEAQVFAYGRYHTIDLALLEGDIEEPAGDTYMPAREVEVNMSESFPPQYVDVAAPLVEAVNSGKIEMELRLAAMSTEESLKGRTLPKKLGCGRGSLGRNERLSQEPPGDFAQDRRENDGSAVSAGLSVESVSRNSEYVGGSSEECGTDCTGGRKRKIEERVDGDKEIEDLCQCRRVFNEGDSQSCSTSTGSRCARGFVDEVEGGGKRFGASDASSSGQGVGLPCGRTCWKCRNHGCQVPRRERQSESTIIDIPELERLSPGYFSEFVWPKVDTKAVDESLCYHAKRFVEASSQLDQSLMTKTTGIVQKLERMYSSTKVVWKGWPSDFRKFIVSSVDWNSSPGWPWKAHWTTNRDLFGFDGVNVDPLKLAMVENAVRLRWEELKIGVVADPIFPFVKPEPHKVSKADRKAWRLISGVGLTDTLVDRILYGDWMDEMIERWIEIPSKAGWSPQQGGFKWLAKSFRDKVPLSVDKSSWDWTVNEWHVAILERLVPRMLFGIGDDWNAVFRNRMRALFHAGFPVFKMSCGCKFEQLVTGIMKSGCFGTIGFNSICQVASHLSAGGSETDLFFSLGDDTVQEMVKDLVVYMSALKATGAIVKEADVGFPIKFGGHDFSEDGCEPSYRSKHMFLLRYLDADVAAETLDSYRHLYALNEEVGDFLEKETLRLFGPKDVLSRDYLREWYLSLE